jgi:hypothetical protein
MHIDHPNNQPDPTVQNNKPEPSVKNNVEDLIEKISKDPYMSSQALIAAQTFLLYNALTNISVKMSQVRAELGLAAMQAGFNSADETATAGLFQLGGGAILAGTGVVQGIAGCKGAAEFAKAAEWRNAKIAEINDALKDGDLSLESSALEGPDMTVEVKALDEPVTPGLNKAEEEVFEEEVFYDAEETLSSKTLSCKQTKPEEQVGEIKREEQAPVQNKMSEEEAKELIKEREREYNVQKDLIESKAGRFEGLGGIGQGMQNASQGLGEVEKAKGQKETIQKEIAQDNQNQIGNTADDLRKKADEIAKFDSFRSNSSSLKG